MEITFTENRNTFIADLTKPIDISIEISFYKEQLSAFDGPPASKRPYHTEGFIGNVDQGGSCNCDVISVSPHLNGTHTECVGHITQSDIYLNEVLEDSFMIAKLISIEPIVVNNDLVITKERLQKELDKLPFKTRALVIRTLPNNEEKKMKHYSSSNAAFFSVDAMQLITDNNIEHLLVDLPSVDKMDDGGALLNHRIFWGIEPGQKETESPSSKTITELVFIPSSIKDGLYFLNLQVPSMNLDAVPSRPVLYEVKNYD
jgi:kynurenine formamidase